VAVIADGADRVRHFIYDELDLDRARDLAKETHKHWDDEMVERADCAYRNFLWVCWNYDKNGNSVAWIDTLADEMWHCHMLLPASYLAASERIFGKGSILDHTPVLPNGRRVSHIEMEQASAEYTKLGLPVPTELRYECVWAVVRV
jgi:hypothetical protein